MYYFHNAKCGSACGIEPVAADMVVEAHQKAAHAVAGQVLQEFAAGEVSQRCEIGFDYFPGSFRFQYRLA